MLTNGLAGKVLAKDLAGKVLATVVGGKVGDAGAVGGDCGSDDGGGDNGEEGGGGTGVSWLLARQSISTCGRGYHCPELCRNHTLTLVSSYKSLLYNKKFTLITNAEEQVTLT